METKGKLQGITRDWESGKPIVAFEIQNPNALEGIETLKDKELWIEAKVYRKKRSLSQNDYLHVLVRKLVEESNPPVTEEYMKNILIGKYGQHIYLDDGIPVVYKTNAPPEYMLEQKGLHVKVARGGENNIWFYYLMKPTRQMDTREMSRLIDGAIEECRELGIQTDTPQEIERLKAIWESNKNR